MQSVDDGHRARRGLLGAFGNGQSVIFVTRICRHLNCSDSFSTLDTQALPTLP